MLRSSALHHQCARLTTVLTVALPEQGPPTSGHEPNDLEKGGGDVDRYEHAEQQCVVHERRGALVDSDYEIERWVCSMKSNSAPRSMRSS
jgi:hypothetical protein